MPKVSNFQDFNLPDQMPEVQTSLPMASNDKMMTEVIRGFSNSVATTVETVPAVMREQRENFRTILDVLDMMEDKGMIKVTRPQVVEVEKEGWSQYLAGVVSAIGAVILFGLIF